MKEYTFNGGMKVIDVAVEDLNIDQSGRPGINENTILGFAIGDDYRLNVKQYTGTLEDGSELPTGYVLILQQVRQLFSSQRTFILLM